MSWDKIGTALEGTSRRRKKDLLAILAFNRLAELQADGGVVPATSLFVTADR